MQKKAFLVLAVLLIFIAIYTTFLSEKKLEKEQYAIELIKKAIRFGEGKDEYLYSFVETSDGYPITYTLLLKNGIKKIDIENLLSKKEVYFLENDTILCIDFDTRHACSSFGNTTDPRLLNYLAGLKEKFFSDDSIQRQLSLFSFFLEKGCIRNITLSESEDCTEVSYTIDYSNITLSEANKYGIMLQGPKKFQFSVCVNNATSVLHRKYFNYSFSGFYHEWSFELLNITWEPEVEVSLPENLSDGAYALLLEEKRWQGELKDCLIKKDEERRRCIFQIAIESKHKTLCELIQTRDRCLIALVPLTLDPSICDDIENASFKDDCYIEMAGGTKNDSFCSSIRNQSKLSYCINVSMLQNPAAENCEERGYDYEIRENESGQYGICMYEGMECEEWELYRGECCLTPLDCDCSDPQCINSTCVCGESG